jgi:hypothetical protein
MQEKFPLVSLSYNSRTDTVYAVPHLLFPSMWEGPPMKEVGKLEECGGGWGDDNLHFRIIILHQQQADIYTYPPYTHTHSHTASAPGSRHDTRRSRLPRQQQDVID